MVPFRILAKVQSFQPLTPEEQEIWDRRYEEHQEGDRWRDGMDRPEIFPTNQIPVVRLEDGQRRVDLMRWGLVPSWTKDLKDVRSTFNARVESAATKPSFRSAWKARHCLVVLDGIYEWTGEKPRRKPNLVHITSEKLIAIAGLWESWTDKTTGEVVESCTMLIREPVGFFATFHDRMPIVLPDRETQDAWLDHTSANSFSALDRFVTDWNLVPLPNGIPRNDNAGKSLPKKVEPAKVEEPKRGQMKLFG